LLFFNTLLGKTRRVRADNAGHRVRGREPKWPMQTLAEEDAKKGDLQAKQSG
jgi:hypothetical protein